MNRCSIFGSKSSRGSEEVQVHCEPGAEGGGDWEEVYGAADGGDVVAVLVDDWLDKGLVFGGEGLGSIFYDSRSIYITIEAEHLRSTWVYRTFWTI